MNAMPCLNESTTGHHPRSTGRIKMYQKCIGYRNIRSTLE